MTHSALRGLVVGVIGLACARAAPSASGHWNAVGPLRGDGTPVPIFAAAFVPGSATLYVGADEGAFRSDDGGAHWTPLGGALSDSRGVLSLAVDPRTPSTLYAGTYGGLYKSIDSGASWIATWTDEVVYAVAVDPASPRTLYAGTGPMGGSVSGFFKSVDGGESRARLLHTDDYYGFASVAVDPTATAKVYAGTYLGHFFSSADAGASWSETPGDWRGKIQSIAIDPLSSATVYAASWQTVTPMGPGLCNVVKSGDSGRTFSAVPGLPEFGASAVAVDPKPPFRVYAGVSGAVYESSDGGTSWAPITDDPLFIDASAFVFDPLRPGHLYAVAYGLYDIDLGSNRAPVEQPAAARPRPRVLPRP